MSRARWLAFHAGAAAELLLAWPPAARGLEASLAGHMLVQIPLLVGVGALMAASCSPGAWPRRIAINEHGAPGMVLAISLLAYWMLPRALDAALLYPVAEIAKFLTVPLAGALLVLSWPRLGFVGKGVLVLNAASMSAADGWLYCIAPVRLCNSYLIDDQSTVGAGYLGLAAVLLCGVVWRLLFGFGGERISDVPAQVGREPA